MVKTIHGTTTAWTPMDSPRGSAICAPLSPFPVTVAKFLPASQKRWARKAESVKHSRMIARTAARDGSFCEPTTAKKISVDRTPWVPPSTSGLPKSAMLSMKPIRKALARPGFISGSDTRQKVRQRSARSVCEASSIDGLTPSTTPISTRNEMGVKERTCAIQMPVMP
ncbi:hypothetical protein D3C78_1452240 [compost metagenome]